jgi:ACR3 family arsenite transporter
MIRFLSFCGRHGRVCLVGGLVMGIALPDLALAMRPRIAPMVVLLLFLAVLRLGPEGIRAGLHGIRGAIGAVLVFQMVAPLMAVAGFAALGWLGQASKAPIGMTISRPDPDGKEAVPVRRLFQRPALS